MFFVARIHKIFCLVMDSLTFSSCLFTNSIFGKCLTSNGWLYPMRVIYILTTLILICEPQSNYINTDAEEIDIHFIRVSNMLRSKIYKNYRVNKCIAFVLIMCKMHVSFLIKHGNLGVVIHGKFLFSTKGHLCLSTLGIINCCVW